MGGVEKQRAICSRIPGKKKEEAKHQTDSHEADGPADAGGSTTGEELWENGRWWGPRRRRGAAKCGMKAAISWLGFDQEAPADGALG